MQNYEGSEAFLSGKTLRRLSEVLGVSVSWLMNETEYGDPAIPSESALGGKSDGTKGRSSRIISRLLELSDIEFARTEPALLSVIDAVIASRPVDGQSRFSQSDLEMDPAVELAALELGRHAVRMVRERRDEAPPPTAQKLSPIEGAGGAKDRPQQGSTVDPKTNRYR